MDRGGEREKNDIENGIEGRVHINVCMASILRVSMQHAVRVATAVFSERKKIINFINIFFNALARQTRLILMAINHP